MPIRNQNAATLELNGRNVVVVGLGKSGRAAAEFLSAKGADVVVSDMKPESELAELATHLRARGVGLDLGGHSESTFAWADLIVISPGVPGSIEPIRKAMARGVPVTGEIELAARFISSPIVAVTGTNGKTTTTSLIGSILKAAGKQTFVGGNIGNPLIEYVQQGQGADVVVIEVSSFQLETLETLKPAAAVLLNVTPDHLDRYADFEAYAAAKARLFSNQTESDTAIMNADDPVVRSVSVKSRRWEFSRLAPVDSGASLSGDRLAISDNGRTLTELPLRELNLVGAHNQENVMASPAGRAGRWAYPLKQPGRPPALSRDCPTGWSLWPSRAGSAITTTPKAPTWARSSSHWRDLTIRSS